MFKNHPRGLAPLFFTEMWERLQFYLLVGILVVYASDVERGGLGLPLEQANRINGTYLAMVYFTPFLGGLIADRWLGYRRSVLIGGLLFIAGLVMLGMPGMSAFYAGLTLVCCGNGFFKPNISAMVGNLYERGDPRRDTGFNVFYMGINIGAAVANLAAAPIRNVWGWRWTFFGAAIGMAIGLVVLIMNWKLLESADRKPERTKDDASLATIFGKILVPAAVFGAAGYFLAAGIPAIGSKVAPSYCGFLLGMVPVFFSFWRMSRTAPEAERPGLAAILPIYLAGGTFFMVLHMNSSALTVWANNTTDRQVSWVPRVWTQDALPAYFGNADSSVPRPDERTLVVVDALTAKMAGTKKLTDAKAKELAALPGLRAVTTWTSANGAENVPERTDELGAFVYPDDEVKIDAASNAVTLVDGAHAAKKVAFVAGIEGKDVPVVLIDQKTRDKVYAKAGAARLPPGEFIRVVNPEIYQSWNPICVVLFTPLVIGFFAMLTKRGRQVSTAKKLFYGMLLTSGSMLVMSIAGHLSDGGNVKVAGAWLVGTYAVITFGELCLSPMGLSLVTKLSPKRYVGLMMGGWFCATSFGNKLSGFLAELKEKLPPSTFFLVVMAAALAVAGLLRLALPKLNRTLQQYGA